MTGSDITTVRKALGLDPFAFAAVLGVHVSTVYRWETAKKSVSVSVDPLQREILHGLYDARRHKSSLRDLGLVVRDALISRGNLGGLHAILKFLLSSKGR